MKARVESRSIHAIWPWLVGLVAVVSGLAYLEWPRADPNVLWNRAQAALQARNVPEAAALLDQIGRLRAPTDADWMLRAQVAMGEHRGPDAIAALEAIPDASPFAARARLMAGQVELRQHRMRFAEAHLRQALALDPNLLPARRELVYILGMQTRRQELAREMGRLAELEPLTFDHLFTWCLTRGTVWESSEIVATMARNLEADPQDKWSRLALVEGLRNEGRLDDAESALQPLSNDDPDARAARVRLALERGDVESAQTLLDDGPEDHPDLARLRGRLALLRRDPAAAVRYFRAADAAEPNVRDTTLGLAQALRIAGDDAEAQRYAALARDHDAVLTLMQYAATEQGRGDPSLPLRLGAAHEAIGRLDEARAWYQLAIDRNPLDPAAQKALARFQQVRSRTDLAAPAPTGP